MAKTKPGRALSALFSAVLLFSPLAIADSSSTTPAPDSSTAKTLREVMPVKTARPSYEYEQCFNACQQALDKALERCLPEIDLEDQEAQTACKRSAIDDFEQSLARCPIDTGRRDQR